MIPSDNESTIKMHDVHQPCNEYQVIRRVLGKVQKQFLQIEFHFIQNWFIYHLKECENYMYS